MENPAGFPMYPQGASPFNESWLLFVLFISQDYKFIHGIFNSLKPFFIETIISEFSIENFKENILRRIAIFNKIKTYYP